MGKRAIVTILAVVFMAALAVVAGGCENATVSGPTSGGAQGAGDEGSKYDYGSGGDTLGTGDGSSEPSGDDDGGIVDSEDDIEMQTFDEGAQEQGWEEATSGESGSAPEGMSPEEQMRWEENFIQGYEQGLEEGQ